MKILSADDSATIRKIIRGAVEVLGHQFVEASDGKEALAILEEDAADIGLVLLDWNMPVLDGLATLKAIKADPRFSKIPVMMVTTETEKKKVAQAVAAGADNYVTKPFATQDLAGRMMECLGMGF